MLRSGCFLNLLEEYARFELLNANLFGDTTQVPEMMPVIPPTRLLSQDADETWSVVKLVAK